MKFRLGAIPESPDFIPDQAWRPLREPSPWLMQLFAIPLGIVSFAGIGLLWLRATPLNLKLLATPEFLALGLMSFIPLVVVHELLHAAVHPGFGSSNATILGIWPSRLLFYAHYDGELTRNRFVGILAMPMIILTFAPLLVAIITNTSHVLVAWVSTWNALFACEICLECCSSSFKFRVRPFVAIKAGGIIGNIPPIRIEKRLLQTATAGASFLGSP